VGIELAKVPLQTQLTLVDAGDDLDVSRRLACFGLRVGSSFSLVSKTAGGGRVALVAGTRIALGKALLADLRARVNH
jgi:Fe2+ transport system protein FeoA